ncbi:MAG: anhydro-N-acetylmuramic acid kinase [Bacteroidota bacterium]
MNPLRRLLEHEERVVAGVMIGTSLDGIDVAIARIAGSGRGLEVDTLAVRHAPYPPALREALHRNVEAATSSVRDLAQLGALLGRLFAEAVADAATRAGTPLDLVGSHGHTVHHVPVPERFAGHDGVASTLQLGDPPGMAARLGVPVVGDFRTADVALGGQGAPLVPYVDYALFGSPDEHRVLLNLGGIANVTILPAGGEPGDVTAFDTGPANMVLDALAARLFGETIDRDGQHAASGTADEALLADLLGDPYFHGPPPKSTGREQFGTAYVERLVARGLSPSDLLATATELTARSVAEALARFAPVAPEVVIASGGGIHNRELMRRLAEALGQVRVRTTADYGVEPDAKEALCFAVLAHEFANGVPTSLPSVTGASRPALLGALCLP